MELNVELAELRLEGGLLAGRIHLPVPVQISAGQYFMAASGRPDEALAAIVFPAGNMDGWLDLAPPLPSSWIVGMPLHLRGPLGRGFQLPSLVQRVVLAALDITADRLRLLWLQALTRSAGVVLCTQRLPGNLPDEVEVLPLESLPEAVAWAEYLALDGTLPQVMEWKSRLKAVGSRAEALIHIPMPCGGVGRCGACSVLTRRGWKFACEDGPVFNLNELEEK